MDKASKTATSQTPALWANRKKGTDRNISSKHKLKEVNIVTKVSANRFKNCALTSSSNKKDVNQSLLKK